MTHGHRAAPGARGGLVASAAADSDSDPPSQEAGPAPYLTPDVATAVAAAGTAISETLIWISSFTPTPR